MLQNIKHLNFTIVIYRYFNYLQQVLPISLIMVSTWHVAKGVHGDLSIFSSIEINTLSRDLIQGN